MNVDIIERLAALVPAHLTVSDIEVYPHWITALSKRYGLCCFIPAMPGIDLPAAPADAAGGSETWHDLIGRTVQDAARDCLYREDILSRSIGMALLNSALPDPPAVFTGEAQSFFNGRVKDAKTCCIGHFTQAREWRDQGFDVTIIELNPKPGDVPWDDSKPFLERADIVFITGLTLVNGTFDTVIERTPNARERVLFGPSVPFCDLWFDYGITAIGSTRIVQPFEAMDFFRNGGTSVARAPEGCLMKINRIRGELCG